MPATKTRRPNTKMKFAAPLPADRPGPRESQERFMERMAASGNQDALAWMQGKLAAGATWAQLCEVAS